MSEMNAALRAAADRFKQREQNQGGYKKSEFVKTQNGDNFITFSADSEGTAFAMQRAWQHVGPSFPKLFTACDWDWLIKDADGAMALERAISLGKITDDDINIATTHGDPVRSTIMAIKDLSKCEAKVLPSPREQYVTMAHNETNKTNGIFTAPKTVLAGVLENADDFPVFSGECVMNVNRSGEGFGTEYKVSPKPSREAQDVDIEESSNIKFVAYRVRPVAEVAKIAYDFLNGKVVQAMLRPTEHEDEFGMITTTPAALEPEDVAELHNRLVQTYHMDLSDNDV